MRILVIEDEEAIASFIRRGLVAANFSVDCAGDGELGLQLAKQHSYDVIVLDLMLPKRDGTEICLDLRKNNIITPIIILSANTDTMTKIHVINNGADDYLTKPFSFEELLARIRALLRREKHITASKLELADLVCDTMAHTVVRSGAPISLSKKEFELLEYFMRNPGTTLSRAMIIEHVWDRNLDPFSNTVDVHVRSLRKKVCGTFPRKLFHTIRGFGYKIE